MSAPSQQFDVDAGETFLRVFRYGTKPLVTKAITGITRAAPAVVTAPTHGMVDGWPAAVVSAQGMTQINAGFYPPRSSDWSPGTVVDANTVSFNEKNSSDYSAWTSGGFLVYPTAVSLVGMTGTFTVYDNPQHTGTPLLALSGSPGLVFSDVAKTITVQFETLGVSWSTGYYELVVKDSLGVTKELVNGVVNVLP